MNQSEGLWYAICPCEILPGLRMKIHERKFFSKPRRYLRPPPRRRLRFRCLASKLPQQFLRDRAHLGNGEIGFARRCFFIYSSARDPRNDADS